MERDIRLMTASPSRETATTSGGTQLFRVAAGEALEEGGPSALSRARPRGWPAFFSCLGRASSNRGLEAVPLHTSRGGYVVAPGGDRGVAPPPRSPPCRARTGRSSLATGSACQYSPR